MRKNRTTRTALQVMTALSAALLWLVTTAPARAAMSFQLTQYEEALTAYTSTDGAKVLHEYAAGDFVAVTDEDDDYIYVLWDNVAGVIPKGDIGAAATPEDASGADAKDVSGIPEDTSEVDAQDAAETSEDMAKAAPEDAAEVGSKDATAGTPEEKEDAVTLDVNALGAELQQNFEESAEIAEEVERRAAQRRTRTIWGSVIGVIAVVIILINLIPVLRGTKTKDAKDMDTQKANDDEDADKSETSGSSDEA